MARFTRMQVLNAILDDGLVPVFYHADVEVAKKVAEACATGGSRVFEFTNRGDFAPEVFKELSLYLARELVRENKHVSVATTSLAVAYTLFNSEIDVLLFGGFLRREIPDLVGPLTERNLEGFHADKLFMGCDGLTVEEGFFTSDLNISTIEAKMVKSAGQVIVLTDSSKFGKKSFVKFAGHDEIDTVVTDGGVDAAVVDGFRKRGVEVIIAG